MFETEYIGDDTYDPVESCDEYIARLHDDKVTLSDIYLLTNEARHDSNLTEPEYWKIYDEAEKIARSALGLPPNSSYAYENNKKIRKERKNG